MEENLLKLLQFTFSVSVQSVSFLLPLLFFFLLFSCVHQLMFRMHLCVVTCCKGSSPLHIHGLVLDFNNQESIVYQFVED